MTNRGTERHKFQGSVVSLSLACCSSCSHIQCMKEHMHTQTGYSWAWMPQPCVAEWILLWWESGRGSTPLPLFDSSRAWLPLSLLWHAYEYLCVCMWKKRMGTGISTLLHSAYVCVYISVFVCVGNTSNGRLMIGLIDTQQWMRAFVSSRDALWKA